MAPGSLAQVLSRLPRLAWDDVLVGPETSDDAGAVRLPDGSALLSTVDFITPLCDDPATFGRIAAANSASDVFAMGGRGIAALSIACYPSKDWPAEVLGEILRGGAEKLAEAGIPVVGGHTVDDAEMKIGYAVMGLADPAALWRNSTARPGDALLLTKPIGTGVLSSAARKGESGPWWEAALDSMQALNLHAARALAGFPVSAVTDVTGFGLAGHAAEMARGSGTTVRLVAESVPLLPEALALQKRGFATRGRAPNTEYARPWETRADPALLDLLVDPQTSGGLLVATPDPAGAAQRLTAAGCFAARVGSVEDRGSVALVIE